uniref:uncharacterized protein n=1 Tax=Pristiophorus japonicus TaxID=55135 RepID=UPI00398F3D16
MASEVPTDTTQQFKDIFTTMEFDSYEEFALKLEEFQQATGSLFNRASSHTVAFENKRRKKPIAARFQFTLVKLCCVHYGQPRTKSTGLRPIQRHLPVGCEATFTLAYSGKRLKLFVRSHHLVHTHHVLRKESLPHYSRRRRLSPEELEHVAGLPKRQFKNKQLKEYIEQRFNKMATLSDIRNIKTRLKAGGGGGGNSVAALLVALERVTEAAPAALAGVRREGGVTTAPASTADRAPTPAAGSVGSVGGRTHTALPLAPEPLGTGDERTHTALPHTPKPLGTGDERTHTALPHTPKPLGTGDERTHTALPHTPKPLGTGHERTHTALPHTPKPLGTGHERTHTALPHTPKPLGSVRARAHTALPDTAKPVGSSDIRTHTALPLAPEPLGSVAARTHAALPVPDQRPAAPGPIAASPASGTPAAAPPLPLLTLLVITGVSYQLSLRPLDVCRPTEPPGATQGPVRCDREKQPKQEQDGSGASAHCGFCRLMYPPSHLSTEHKIQWVRCGRGCPQLFHRCCFPPAVAPGTYVCERCSC